MTFLCGERSIRPALSMDKIVEIQGVVSLQKALKELLSNIKYDSVVHSMAVSDYTIRGLATEDALINELLKAISDSGTVYDEKQLYSNIQQAISNALYSATGKISSDFDSLTVFMDRAPKVISCVKQIQPNTILVGFKLLSHVAEEALIQAAQEQMRSNGSDFVLANDLSNIEGDHHQGMLIGSDGILDRPATKQDIAESIASHVIGKMTEQR